MDETTLVVEDDEAILHLIDVALTMNYYKVVTGERSGLSPQNRTTRFILLDLGLPDIDGLSLIQQFETLWTHLLL